MIVYTYELEIPMSLLTGVVFFPLTSLWLSTETGPTHDRLRWHRAGAAAPETSMKDHIVRSDMLTGHFLQTSKEALARFLASWTRIIACTRYARACKSQHGSAEKLVLRQGDFVGEDASFVFG